MVKVQTQKQPAVARAVRLIAALARGVFSDELHRRLVRWFLSAPENGVVEKTLAEWAAQNVKPESCRPGRGERAGFRRLVEALGLGGYGELNGVVIRLVRRTLQVAAVVVPVALVATGVVVMLQRVAARETVILADNPAGYETFTLPDDTRVSLTHGSTLVYRGDFLSHRTVRLEGEAFFEVTHDALHPFSVENEGMSVVVLGTTFNVKTPDDTPEAEIILVSGRVAVTAGDCRTELTPGQKLTLDRSKGVVTALSQVGKGTMLRVSHSDLRVADVHAAEALRIVSDYFGKELVIEAGVWTDDRLNIELPIDATLEEAIRCLNALSDSATCYVSEERIIIEKKQKNN